MTEIRTIHGGGASLDDRGEGDRQRRTFEQSESAKEWREIAPLMASNPVDRINKARIKVEAKTFDELPKQQARDQEKAELDARHRRQRLLLAICLGPVVLWAVLNLLVASGYI